MPDSKQGAPIDRRTLLASIAIGAGGISGTSFAASQGARAPSPGLPSAWIDAESLPLWDGAPPGVAGFRIGSGADHFPAGMLTNIARPELKVFRPSTSNGRALVSIPGGGYATVSVVNEGLQIARRMTDAGYTVFVLAYRLPREGWNDRADVPLQDAQRAMRLIRKNAGRYGFNPQQVAVVGFSAGGHLAASLATAFAETTYPPRDTLDHIDARPAATGLIYPVIAMDGPYAHKGSATFLLGPQPSPELIARRSPQRQVTDATPPIFLTHAVDDGVVPMQNSVMMLEALSAARRPVEAHFFPKGGHGFGLGPSNSRAASWPGLFAAWLDTCLAA